MLRAFTSINITRRYLKQYSDLKMIPSCIRKAWANEVLSTLGFEIQIDGAKQMDGPVIFVANHSSYIDIPLLMTCLDDISFLSKREVANWPIFGKAARSIETIFVDRGSKDSRQRAKEQIAFLVKNQSKRIVVFPSGTTSLANDKTWRKGVFEIARDHAIPIQPIRIEYSKPRIVAYFGHDFLPVHLCNLSIWGPYRVQMVLSEPIYISNVESDLELCRRWCTSGDSFANRELSTT